jgi:outer membrane protein assembly factor BamB
MQQEVIPHSSENWPSEMPTHIARKPRLWFPLVIVALFWALSFAVGRIDKPYFIGFLYAMASAAVLVLAYSIWWWANRRIPLSRRAFGFVLILGAGAIVEPFCHPSVGWFGVLFTGLPIVLTVWTLWLLVEKRIWFAWFRLGSLAIVTLTWACFTLIRIDGIDSDLHADVHWRWTPSEEDLFLAERRNNIGAGSVSDGAHVWTPQLLPDDWTGFRGPDREGLLHGIKIDPDWKSHPPEPRWRQRVGPAWSSVIVIDDRLFTQEQRGEIETIVCYQASTGGELWVHGDKARFWETVSEAGPRATPTYAEGRIYTMGGTGIVNCLDAATGQLWWTHDVRAEADAKIPMWGYSSSPLVVDSKVIVFAGGEASLRAYGKESGELAWTAEAGPASYSSPQLVTLAGQPQILMLSETGLSSFDPANGAKLWQHGLSMPGAPRTLQPHLLGSDQLVVGTLEGNGVALIQVSHDEGAWKIQERWQSTQLKPEFPDFVVHDGHAYGFDVSIFECLDLATGKRTWKEGRYGRGQVVLLADQNLLVVTTELTGEVILLTANPRQHEELGRFQAIKGKNWNHPVIARGRLYVRNAQEMACYDLAP